jgi:hypothetical protein
MMLPTVTYPTQNVPERLGDPNLHLLAFVAGVERELDLRPASMPPDEAKGDQSPQRVGPTRCSTAWTRPLSASNRWLAKPTATRLPWTRTDIRWLPFSLECLFRVRVGGCSLAVRSTAPQQRTTQRPGSATFALFETVYRPEHVIRVLQPLLEHGSIKADDGRRLKISRACTSAPSLPADVLYGVPPPGVRPALLIRKWRRPYRSTTVCTGYSACARSMMCMTGDAVLGETTGSRLADAAAGAGHGRDCPREFHVNAVRLDVGRLKTATPTGHGGRRSGCVAMPRARRAESRTGC